MAATADVSLLSQSVDLEVIVPAFNEQRRIVGTLVALVGQLERMPVSAHVRVVDNGSSDRTPDLVDWVSRTHRGVVVTIEGCSQRGKGSAVARGMVTSQARWVGFCDADLATPAEALVDAVALLGEGWPVVIGSRYVPGASLVATQPPLRRLGGAGFRLAARRLAGAFDDTQCGFKFFRGDLARALFADLCMTGFAFDVEVLARAGELGLAVKELPVAWSDQAGSTFQPLRHGAEALVDLWRLHRARRPVPADLWPPNAEP